MVDECCVCVDDVCCDGCVLDDCTSKLQRRWYKRDELWISDDYGTSSDDVLAVLVCVGMIVPASFSADGTEEMSCGYVLTMGLQAMMCGVYFITQNRNSDGNDTNKILFNKYNK